MNDKLAQHIKIKQFTEKENIKNLMKNLALISRKVKEKGNSQDTRKEETKTTINFSKLNMT